MYNEIKKHTLYYTAFLLILVFGTISILAAAPNRELQMRFVAFTTIGYILFGIVHHMYTHDISIKIVVEYVLMGSLGMTIIFFILKGGSL